MHCPQCGVQLSQTSNQCPSCHTNLMVPCPRCNFKNLVGQQFCGSCEIDLANPEQPIHQEIPSKIIGTETPVQYPLLSAELMHLDLLGEKLNNPDQLARLSRDLMIRIESQLVGQNAIIESIRENVIFFSFHEKNLPQALSKGFKVAVGLTKKTIKIHGVDLRLRVGMDLVFSSDKAPMSAVGERTIAKAGEVVVSPNIYQMTQRELEYESIGPLKVQGQLKTLFRLVSLNKPSPQSQSIPKRQASAAGEAAAQETNPAVTPRTTKTITPLKSESARSASGKGLKRKIEPQEPPRQLSYQHPVFVTLQQAGKASNIHYQEAHQAIEKDLLEPAADKKRQGKLIGIAAPVGMGKSTIISAIRSQVPEDALFWVGGSFYRYYQNNLFPLSFWIEMVHNLLGLPIEGIPADQGEGHLQTVLKSIYGESFTPDRLDFFKAFFAMEAIPPISPESRQYLGRIVYYLGDLLANIARVKPLVIVMENLQYADNASIELLLQLFQSGLMDSNVRLVMTYTPETEFQGAFQQAISMMAFKEYVLDKVDESMIEAMASAPLSVPWKKLPDSLRAQLLDKGSPLFVEESFRWLEEQGGLAIQSKTGKFTLQKKLKSLAVPEDIHLIVRERFEKLDETCRYTLQVASVLGERFSTTALADLTRMPEQFETIMNFLWRSGYILPDSPVTGRFRNQLIWDVAYESLADSARQKLHEIIGEYLSQGQQGKIHICPLFVAFHYERSGQLPKALESWEQASAWLANIGSITGSSLGLFKVKELMDKLSAEIQEQKQLDETLAILNMDTQPEYAKNLFLMALHALPSENIQERIRLQVFLGQTYERLGQYALAMSTIHRIISEIPPSQNAVERVALASQELWYLYVLGRYQEANQVYNQEIVPYLSNIRQLWEDSALRASFAKGELARCRIALMQCKPQTLNLINDCATQCEIHQEPFLALQFRLTRCMAYLFLGNYDSCQRDMKDIYTSLEQVGFHPELTSWWGIIGLMYHCDIQDWGNASMLIPNTLYQSEQARDYLSWCLTQDLAGRISYGAGNYPEAQNILEQAVTLATEFELLGPALTGWRFIADNELAMGNLDSAEEFCTRAIEVSQRPEVVNWVEFYQLTLTQAKIYITRKQYQEAGMLLEKHWPTIVKTGYTPLIAEAAYQIAEMYGQLSATLPEAHRGKYLMQHRNFLEKAKTLWQEQGNKARLNALTGKESVSVA